MDLKNKTIIITGSSSGIGEATAYLFAKNGANVVVNSNLNSEAGEKVVKKIKEDGGKAIYFQADVSDEIQVRDMVQKTLDEFGGIDILINNAGGYESHDFISMKKDDWLRVFNNNLFGTITCSQEVAKVMLKKGGKILNTASVYGLEHTGDPDGMAYSVAKAGVISLTKNLAKLWAPKIHVNAVAPGYVHLPRFDSIPKKSQESMIAEMKLERWIKPEEIAESFLFLAKNDAVTGEVLVVDAGFTLKG